MTVNELLSRDGARIEKALEEYLPNEDCLQGDLMRAMRYAVMNGGKRIRPVLTLEFCRVCGQDSELALPFACGVEMVHTYSLIHDDLPCMDDDDLRRGKPACHIAFGEDIALLAGDALLSLAFETVLKTDPKSICPTDILRAARELAEASGACGMVGGQVIDLQQEGKPTSYEVLQEMHLGKTGRMIMAAAKMGCYAAGADADTVQAAQNYAADIGRVFQIVDDILDVTSDEQTLGKPIGSDAQNQKTTYYTLLGKEESMRLAQELTHRAMETVQTALGEKSVLLCDLADYLLHRIK